MVQKMALGGSPATRLGPDHLRDSESAPRRQRVRQPRAETSRRCAPEEIPISLGGHDSVQSDARVTRNWQCRVCVCVPKVSFQTLHARLTLRRLSGPQMGRPGHPLRRHWRRRRPRPFFFNDWKRRLVLSVRRQLVCPEGAWRVFISIICLKLIACTDKLLRLIF